MQITATMALTTGLILGLLMLYFAFVSWREEEPRAMKLAVALAFLLPIPYLAASLIDFQLQTPFSLVLLVATLLAIIILLLPIGKGFAFEEDTPTKRIDERDIMFSRMQLVHGSDRFRDYYRRHPEKRALDDRFRSRPGLMQPGALYYDTITSAAAEASFKTVSAFHAMLDVQNLSASPQQKDPAQITQFLKQWAKKLGAVSVGITELQDYHLYSVIGRGQRYGEAVELDHSYAIALTVEMDKVLLDRAPYGPTAMESAQQYLNSGAIAVQIAEFIRQLGYASRAHIDGSYRLVCPLVARDAGLGEIGRMGLLMTPELGPRLRLAVVTTELPLIPDKRQQDGATLDFCRRCKKCADVCPSGAISFDDREAIDGVKRWQINSEACFTYWCTVGTDCGRCMSVCPYAHPDNLLHNMVRAGVKQSSLFRELALKLDDAFYGRQPATLDIPDWIGDVIA
ncbi:MAG: reductive dehalogenase [Chloroflexi bacterium]|nr:reductive dehalogenase [Chloroflexota bacterium]